MRPISTRFPDFNHEKFVEVTRLIVEQRNAVGTINKMYSDSALGLAILACNVVRNHFQRIAGTESYEWLTFGSAPGLAYVLCVAGVPIRVQPDCPEIRDILPEERKALKNTSGKSSGSLFPDDEAALDEALRLEVSQRPGHPVSRVTLSYVNTQTGHSLDSLTLYQKESGYLDGVAHLQRQAETPDLSGLFSLKPANDANVSDGDVE